MSKSKGNVVDPWEVCEKFGADTLRWYLYAINQAGEPKKFDIKNVADKNRRIFGTLLNSFSFFKIYQDKSFKPKETKPVHILDKWIISRYNSLNELVINGLEKYDVVSAARSIDDFIDDFSNWYIRRSRARMQKPENKKEKEQATQILYKTLFDLSKLLAPFAPFITEDIYQNLKTLKDPLSIHLCDYPKPEKKYIDLKLEDNMGKARKIAADALAKRAQGGIKVRQPLNKLTITDKIIASDKELIELIKDEINVKEIVLGKKFNLDTKITEELKQEGLIRDLIRSIQELRKQADLKPGQLVSLLYQTNSDLEKLIVKNKKNIEEETATKIEAAKKDKCLAEKEVDLDGKKIWLGIEK